MKCYIMQYTERCKYEKVHTRTLRCLQPRLEHGPYAIGTFSNPFGFDSFFDQCIYGYSFTEETSDIDKRSTQLLDQALMMYNSGGQGRRHHLPPDDAARSGAHQVVYCEDFHLLCVGGLQLLNHLTLVGVVEEGDVKDNFRCEGRAEETEPEYPQATLVVRLDTVGH